MSSLSPHEAAAVFAALIPGFRLDARGKYRGPASYRGGNNPTALSVDTAKGVWFDHVTGKGGDVIDFVKLAKNTDCRIACKAIADVIGRPVFAGIRFQWTPYPARTLAKASLFRDGLASIIDRTLELVKPLLWCADQERAGAVVYVLTQALPRIRQWSDYVAADRMKAMLLVHPALVRRCVADALEAQILLAKAISGVL